MSCGGGYCYVSVVIIILKNDILFIYYVIFESLIKDV